MSTGSIERRRKGSAAPALARFGLWVADVRRRLISPVGTMREDEMPDWIRRDIGWDDGPAERPRAVIDGWDRPSARVPTRGE